MSGSTDIGPEPRRDLVIRDVAVLDCTGREPSGRHDVAVRDGRIAAIRPAGEGSPTHGDAREIDGAGTTLMPGLTDAHVHFAIIGPRGDHGDEPLIDHVLRVAAYIEGALDEGFTTVRDAGGLEPAWAKAVEKGLVRGPRILPSGSVLSQTGGHGDDRAAHEAVHHGEAIPGLIARHVIVDGADEVRRAVREQLRRGASQIKLLASGGIVSPTDPFDSVQFSAGEIAAAVEVAQGWHTYVLAHCHTSPAIQVAIENGVRSIEHGSLLDEATARRMKELGVFMVPTLQTIDKLVAHPEWWSLPPEKVARLEEVRDEAAKSVRLAREVGVQVASGSDVVGPRQGRRGEEVVIKSRLIGVHEAVRSATAVNAALFRMEDRIGTVEEGKDADLILVSGEPLDRVELLADPDCLPVVLKGGRIVKDAEGRAAAV
ncbi:MAG TPA: amidohydrolase family protein [Candidatus Limnocylindrales bacterium]|nr:amidohydrolase family protein [Candidatus Limnocylindrales bacterium]